MHHDVHVDNIRLKSRGIRLHPALWSRIDREAKSLRIRPTDYLRRKVEDCFHFDPDVPNMPESGHSNPNRRGDELPVLEEEDEGA